MSGCRRIHHIDGGETIPVEYATGFSLTRYDGYIVADLRDPWDTTQLLNRYILVSKELPLPDVIPAGTLIRVPIERIAVYTSVHAAIIDELEYSDHIVGICESQYITRNSIKKNLSTEQTIDLGNSFSPDVERMIAIAPDAIIVSPFENCNYGRVEKLGIPIIECADYMENTPLGRAEWIRFLGILTGKIDKADSLFAATKIRYEKLCKLAQQFHNRPTVLCEKKIGGTWFVPGGNSYMAQIITDAGATYIWHNDNHSGSLALSFEDVYDQAQNADYWLFKYTAPQNISLQTLGDEFAHYKKFNAYTHNNVYGCNLTHNTFFEEIPIYPDLLLSEFIAIFHPEMHPPKKLQYYHRLMP